MRKRFTVRQREVMELRCRDGLTIKEAAAKMGIAPRSVKGYSTTIMRRWGARSLAQACFWCGMEWNEPLPPGSRPETV